MIRPVSITRYERLYLASFVIGLIVSAMSWGPRRAMVAATPMLAKIGWILPTFEVAGIVITLTLATATLSYLWVERPAIRWSHRQWPGSRRPTPATASAAPAAPEPGDDPVDEVVS